jgi:hypothetical protein
MNLRKPASAWMQMFWRVDNLYGDPLLVWMLEENEQGWWVERIQSNPDLPVTREFLSRDEWTRETNEHRLHQERAARR